MTQPKIAIVCDWLTNFGGAERVIYQFHKMFPDAPIFTSLYNKEKMVGFEDADVRTSWLQKIPGAKSKHQLFLHFLPGVFESFDLDEFDIVLSSSHSCAKGVITKPETLHICYCHSPMRYAWDESHTYIDQYPLNGLVKRIVPHFIHKIRMWDRLSAERVDKYISNSAFVQKRIEKYYGKNSMVIHPPVECDRWPVSTDHGDYYLAVGRITTYKRFDLLVETFNQLGLPLKIVGTGPDLKKLKQIANSNIEFLGRVSDDDLRELYMNAKGLLFPQVEDFGIIPLEAMSAGTPVIAFKSGGSLETVVEGKTGVFFEEQTVEALAEAIDEFEVETWDPKVIRSQAEKFDEAVFREKLLQFLMEQWKLWQSEMT